MLNRRRNDLQVLTTAQIVATPGERMPFKVVFSKDGAVIAERPVASLEGGRRLIQSLLPLLQKHDGAVAPEGS